MAAGAQPRLISPLPHAIVQVAGDGASRHGELRITVDRGPANNDRVISVDYQILNDRGEPLPTFEWSALRSRDGSIDTAIEIPILRSGVRFQYRIVTPARLYEGTVPNLYVGHVIGIAGQSNAEGWSPPPYPKAIGDLRMLRFAMTWEYGAGATGGKWNGPWIYMANKLRALLDDGLPIGIVNAAEGGTSLVAWSPYGSWKRSEGSPRDTRTVYGRALQLFRSAGGNMEAMFWIQGEADVVGTSDSDYVKAFAQLRRNFEIDLNRSQSFYHFQIGGQLDNPGFPDHPYTWGVIRNAQRHLDSSILVGTAVGYPVSFDGIHYENVTVHAVGERFAGALADKRYNIMNELYQPIEPDSAIVVNIDDSDTTKGKKIVLWCNRGDQSVSFISSARFHGFQLAFDSVHFDTGQTVARVNSNYPERIEITLKDSVLMDTTGWSLSYAILPDVQRANVLDTSTATVLPNALVAFMHLPVSPGTLPKPPVLGFDHPDAEPTKTPSRIYYTIDGRLAGQGPTPPRAAGWYYFDDGGRLGKVFVPAK